jgi:alpha-L-fucosidase
VWPGKEVLLTTVKPRTGSRIYMLGVAEPLPWKYDPARGLAITIPEKLQNEGARPCQYAWTFKIESENA